MLKQKLAPQLVAQIADWSLNLYQKGAIIHYGGSSTQLDSTQLKSTI